MTNSLWTMAKTTAAVVMMLSVTVGADVGVVSEPLLDGDAGNYVDFIVGTEGDLTIQFTKRSLTSMPTDDVFGTADPTVAVSPSSGAKSTTWRSFVGNYVEGGVRGVQFKVRNNGEALPTNMRLSLISDEVAIWDYADIEVEGNGSEWVTNTIVFDRRAGWDCMLKRTTEAQKQAIFERTLSDVTSLSLYLQQDGSTRDKLQSVTVADFVLFGDGWATDQGRLAVGLIQNFGVKSKHELSPDQLTQDSDRDGVSDIDAILSGKDPGIALQIVGVGPTGVVIEWPCVAQGVYTVFRADSLNGDFAAIDVVEANTGGYMQYSDSEAAAGAGPYYYKVRKRVGPN